MTFRIPFFHQKHQIIQDSSDIPITADNIALAAGDNYYFQSNTSFVWGYKHYTKILLPQVPAFRD